MARPSKLGLALFAALLAALLAPAPSQAKLEEKDWTKAKKEFEQAFAAGDTNAVLAAVKAIAADQSKRAVDVLVGIGASDKLEDIQIYDAVREALAGMKDGEATGYMIEHLEKKTDAKQWAVRCVLCDALAAVPGPEATKALAGRLEDKIPYVVSSAAKALGKRKDAAAVDALVKRLAELEKAKDVTWIDVRQALTDITGYDYQSAKEWEGFWASKRDSFDPAKDRGDKKDVTTDVRDEAKFFTEPIVSKRIMYVIDTSGSMDSPDIPVEGKGKMKRIDVVKNALAASIHDLKSDVRFNIIGFSHIITPWRPSKAGLQSANAENKADAMRWVSNLKAFGATHTDDALKEAFANLDVNTIVLLSDGQPVRALKNGGGEPIDEKKILEQVQAWNRLRNVKIHTFGFKVFETMQPDRMQFFDPQKCLEFLKGLAEENGGSLHKV
jgi:hypothetical protein